MDTFVNTSGGRSLFALFRCGDRWRWCAYDRLIIVFAARSADRTAQELWLLVRLRRQAITGRTFAAARRDAWLGARLYVRCCLRLRRTLKALWPIRALWSVCTLWPV
jgi:hypothetical protein